MLLSFSYQQEYKKLLYSQKIMQPKSGNISSELLVFVKLFLSDKHPSTCWKGTCWKVRVFFFHFAGHKNVYHKGIYNFWIAGNFDDNFYNHMFMTHYYIFSRFYIYIISKADNFELIQNLEEMFPLYCMDSDVISRLKYSTMHWCVTVA